MARIAEILAERSREASGGAPVFSFEFFPPKTPKGEESLYRAIEELRELNPAFVSVTYGAGGSTRAKTVEWVDRIQNEQGVTAMAHLTCVGASRDEIGKLIDELAERGIVNILALRGDPPRGEARFVPARDGFAHADELVAWIRARAGGETFSIGVAGYPEKHPEAPDLETDVRRLAGKIEAGADFVVTQLFFENARFFDFLRRLELALPGRPRPAVLPGIMPITARDQLERFVAMCGAGIPAGLRAEVEAAPDDEAVVEIGIRHAISQCRDLLQQGAPGIHFYTLNKSPATRRILEAIR